jgi:hypothetical protein
MGRKIMRNHIERQIQSERGTHRDPLVRGANAIDRYSLALQLIQVYPIILAGVAIVFPLEWLRIVVAILGLVVWTIWAVIRERDAVSATDQDKGVPVRSSFERAHRATPANTTTAAEAIRGIHIDIRLHSYTGCGHKSVGRRPGHHRVAPRIHCALPREAPSTSSEFCQRAGA